MQQDFPSIDELVQRFEHLRAHQTPLADVFRGALQRLGYTAGDLGEWAMWSGTEVQNAPAFVRLYRTGLQVAAMVENDRQAPYHNRDHAGESVLAAEALVLAHFADANDRKLQGIRLLVAMMGHDVGHPGSAPGVGDIGDLERASAAIVQDCMASYDPREKSVDRDVLLSIIEGTEFCDGPSTNWANHQAFPERVLYTLQVLANDADILASVLPHVGMARGQLLAEEWRRAGSPSGEVVGTWDGRLGFLKAVTLRSAGAERLGAVAWQRAEIAVLERSDLYELGRLPLNEAISTVMAATVAEHAAPTVSVAVPVKARRPSR